MNIDIKNIEAMIYLLDDTDKEIVEQVESQLLDIGSSIVPILEEQWSKDNLSDVHHEKIFALLNTIKARKIEDELEIWKNNPNSTAFEGALLISKALNPNIDFSKIEKELEAIRLDVWLQFQNHLSAWERVRLLNESMFQKHGFQGDREDYHNPDNSLIDKVIENKKGNPISLSILYLTIAQRLNLPIFGVNLPQHFVMAFMPSDFDESTGDFSKKFNLQEDEFVGEPLFYLDAFSEGLPFDKDRLNEFLKEVNIEPKEEYYYPCTNLHILQRVVRNLKHSLAQKEDSKRMEIIESIERVLAS